jgi:WD40-like Beta Propeller Repeat
MDDVVFESEVPLVSGSAAGLYEWQANGSLQLISVLPDGSPAVAPSLGQESTNVRGALSADGSRIVFSVEGEEGEPGGLYMRDTQTHETIKLNAAQGVVEPTGVESEVAFQAATSDGSKVFFTDTAPLAPESTQRQETKADLYECEITEEHGKLGCVLRDLTPLPAGGSADVLNVIPGVSEDGSSVYFVANGIMAPGAVQGHCVHEAQEVAVAGAACNLYVWHDGAISLIAVLSNEDSGDWGSLHGSGRVGGITANRPDLTDVTSRVSPNGQYLAFMSQMPLVGYETLDANHDNEAIHDEEVYIYDASSHLLVCASCDSTGPPVGVHDTPDSGEGNGLLVDRRGDWTGEYLAGSIPGWTPLGLDEAIHQPQYLSDSGRLFFDSPDQLVPQASNGKEDVYEYEPEGVGSCQQAGGCVSLVSSGTAAQESAFVEASEDGDSAFFITAQPLVAADHDTNYDLYDARVCTTSSPCVSSEGSSSGTCEGSRSCQPGSFFAPAPGTPPTATINGAEQQTLSFANTSPPRKSKPRPATRAQLLAKALKSCRTKKRKHARTVCEKQARKRYDPEPKHRGPKKKEHR